MKISILYVGKDLSITKIMIRLLNAKVNWKGFGVCNCEDALEVCKAEPLDLVLLGNGIEEEEEKDLREKLLILQPSVKIIQHYGGGSGLLYAEITGALA
ncbi:DNA-binding NtrC family response regulator [Pedobacter sp. UYEF25]